MGRVGWGAPGASSCAPVTATIPQFFENWEEKGTKGVKAPLQRCPKHTQQSQILPPLPGTLLGLVGVQQPVQVAQRWPPGTHTLAAQRQKAARLTTGSTKLGFWMLRFIQEHVSCIELWVWMGWGAPGASRCSPVAATIPRIFNRPSKNIQI